MSFAFRLALAAAAAMVFALRARARGGEDYSCFSTLRSAPSDDLCANQSDPDTGRSLPNCVNVESESDPKWRCRRCAVNCDCPVREYCVKTPGPLAGTCVPIADGGKVGSTCAVFAVGAVPVRGVDDAVLCGFAAFSEDGRAEFLGYEWLGTCVGGRCCECSGDALGSAYLATAAKQGFWHDTGSLLCQDRYCYRGTVAADPSPFEEEYGFGVKVTLLVFVL